MEAKQLFQLRHGRKFAKVVVEANKQKVSGRRQRGEQPPNGIDDAGRDPPWQHMPPPRALPVRLGLAEQRCLFSSKGCFVVVIESLLGKGSLGRQGLGLLSIRLVLRHIERLVVVGLQARAG